jgi:hypothetical protein
LSCFVELCWPRDVAAGATARDKPKLEATNASAHVDVVVVELTVAMIIALEALVQIEHIEGNVIIRGSIVIVDSVETIVVANDHVVANIVVAWDQTRFTSP